MESILSCKDLYFIYKGTIDTVALNGISFDIFPNTSVALIGKSGSGKTTLLKCLEGIIQPDSGQIYYFNRLLTKYNNKELQHFRLHKLGIINQDKNLISFLNVKENIQLPMKFANFDKKKQYERTKYLTEKFGIIRYLDSYPEELSMGERQRVGIAVALANNPEIILADEPTGNLDVENSAIVYELLLKASEEEKRTILIATHDLNALDYFDRVIDLTKFKKKKEEVKLEE